MAYKTGKASSIRKTIPEALAEALRERILNGEIREGHQLRQDALAEEYDVSRMPVREALRQLEAEGLVVFHTHKGAVVTEPSLDEIGEMFDLRAMLEPDLLKRAMAKMTEDALARAHEALKDMEVAYQTGDVQSWGSANWTFHHALYAPSGRVHTLGLVQTINYQTDRYIRLQLLLTEGGLKQAEEDHRQIFALCQAGEARQAVAYLKQHIEHAKKTLLASMKKARKAKK